MFLSSRSPESRRREAWSSHGAATEQPCEEEKGKVRRERQGRWGRAQSVRAGPITVDDSRIMSN